MDGINLPYERRVYSCSHCRTTGADWKLIRQSPPEFFLQPHEMYPMSQSEFDRWVAILREHFPDHPSLHDQGFFPSSPEGVLAWGRRLGLG